MGYVLGPLQMALGAGALATGVGAPLGIPLIAAGAGETIGQGAGGSRGAGMGEMFGGLAGGLGEGGAGLLGMGPLSSMLGTTSAGEGLQSMLGMSPTGDTQAQNLVSGLTQMPSNFGATPEQTINLPGGGTMTLPAQAGGNQQAFDLLKQSLSATGQQAGFSNMPSFTDQGALPAGWGSLGGTGANATTTSVPQTAGTSSSSSDLWTQAAPDVIKTLTGLDSSGGGGGGGQSSGSKPGFKGPQGSSGQVTAVVPTVSSVPQTPSAPAAQSAPSALLQTNQFLKQAAPDPTQAYLSAMGPQGQGGALGSQAGLRGANAEQILKYLAGES